MKIIKYKPTHKQVRELHIFFINLIIPYLTKFDHRRKTMKQEKNEVLLTVKELHAFGAELNEFTDEIDLNNISIESLEVIKRKDPDSFMFIVSKYLETTYRINEKLFRRIDEIACMLLNADNEKELEGFRNDK